MSIEGSDNPDPAGMKPLDRRNAFPSPKNLIGRDLYGCVYSAYTRQEIWLY